MNHHEITDFLKSGALMSCGKGSIAIAWGRRKWASSPELLPSPQFYFPDFFLHSQEPWFSCEHNRIISIREFLERLSTQTHPLPPIQWQIPYKELFQATFQELKVKFQQNELRKAVPFIFARGEGSMQNERLHTCLKSLVTYALRSPVFLYGFWDETEGMLGATPELLFEQETKGENRVKTVACAGTKSAATSSAELLNDPKERAEHALVVEGIRESLSQLGEVSVGERRVAVLPTLKHLLTPIELKGRFVFSQLVRALHPTPALGAFPKEAGERWLRSYEQQITRKRFGAPVGCMTVEGSLYCYVGIRNIQWEKHNLFLGAGCGVVPESQCEKEWQEIELKLRAIREMLSL